MNANFENILGQIARVHTFGHNVSLTQIVVGACKLNGSATRVADMSIPVVQLATNDSTPQRWNVRPEAAVEIEGMLDQVFSPRGSFYTAIRADWSLPYIAWTQLTNNEVHVRSTGNQENVVEGGYTDVYEVVFCGIDDTLGELVYDRRSFPEVPYFGPEQRTEPPNYPAPTGPIVRQLRNLQHIRDEELDELRERGVTVKVL